uniref:Uncharacterized protein n=1 Tax=Laticauda laticaudata TaxID=8630 RepID=A0A8C5SFY0_LATLA
MNSFHFQVHQEATCPLCLDFFKQPMGLSCGHNFCRDCLAQLDAEVSCPQCKAKVESNSTCPNRALANMVCLVKRLQLPEGVQEESSGQQLCQEHRQPLQIFCSSEKSLLCPSCLGKHQGHPLLSLPEEGEAEAAASEADRGAELEGMPGGSLGEGAGGSPRGTLILRLGNPHLTTPFSAPKEQFATEKQQVGLVLESLQELLRESQPVWLGWLAKQEEKMKAKWEVALGGKQRFPRGRGDRHPCEGQHLFLSSLSGHPGHHRQVGIILLFLTCLCRLVCAQNFWCGRILLNSVAERYWLWDLWYSRSSTDFQQTFHYLTVPFDQEFCVLGSEGFTTGWHWWEVSVQGPYSFPVQGKARWAFGVAKESIPRKKSFQLSPQEGIWAVGKNVSGQIVAFEPTQLVLQGSLQRLWVRLDCKTKEVQFLDGATGALLYTFQTGSFLGEMLRPFFYLGQMGVILQCEKYPVKSMRD